MSSSVKRTYGSRTSRPALPLSSPSSTLASSPTSVTKRKRPFAEQLSFSNLPKLSHPTKRQKLSDNAKPKQKEKEKQKTLTQLHFCIDQPVLRTCPLCDLSYTKGAPDDETLHRAHCARVQKGMEWGREEEKEKLKADVVEIATGVKLKDGRKGRIISFRADSGGKIGSKLTALLATINLTLSSPPLTPAVLRDSKIYLFLLPMLSTSTRERIVGCVIAQRISTAMAIASPEECISACESATPPSVPSAPSPTEKLVAVDTSLGLFCHPKRLPTPLGIPRLFVPSAHRRQGIACKLLSAAAETFIHGCSLDPRKGEVAFTQPTGDGGAVMRKWGGGGIRIYEE